MSMKFSYYSKHFSQLTLLLFRAKLMHKEYLGLLPIVCTHYNIDVWIEREMKQQKHIGNTIEDSAGFRMICSFHKLCYWYRNLWEMGIIFFNILYNEASATFINNCLIIRQTSWMNWVERESKGLQPKTHSTVRNQINKITITINVKKSVVAWSRIW